MGKKKLDSEYKSHFKTLPVHRPITVKAKVLSQPSDSAPEAHESSRRAGLLSNQFSKVSEPALQRKRIVPYKNNHNIFATSTVKELNDGEWLDAVGSDDDSSRAASNRTKKERANTRQSKKKQTEYSSRIGKQHVENESPIMVANKARTSNISRNYDDDRSRQENNVFVKTSERSPERLPPAGRPTYVSHPHDKRLLRPSDGSAYLTFPDEHPRNTETEYSERYYSAKNEEKPATIKNKESGNINQAIYEKILLNRSAAYGVDTLPVKKLSLAGSEKGSVAVDRASAKKEKKDTKRGERKESLSSFRSTDSCKENRDERKKKKAVAQKIRRESVERSRRRSLETESASSVRSSSRLGPRKSGNGQGRYAQEESFVNVKNVDKLDKRTKRRSRMRAWEQDSTSKTSENGTESVRSVRSTPGRRGSRRDNVDRGRSPTPEMRNAGQSRRHHLDVTTGRNNPLASSGERHKTRVLDKMSPQTKLKPRVSYDPSRYSDAGDFSARSVSTLTDRDTMDSRSMVATRGSTIRSS